MEEALLPAPVDAPLAVRRHPVEQWLRELPERKRSAVLQYAQAERSTVLSYLYASMMGMEVSVDDWDAWAQSRYKKLDHRSILETEIMALHQDIGAIRESVEEGRIRRSEAPRKIADLSKELRGHIEHMAKEIGVHDRRSLLLAGVEVTAKMLRKAFSGQPAIWPAIEAALESTWAEIESRHQL